MKALKGRGDLDKPSLWRLLLYIVLCNFKKIAYLSMLPAILPYNDDNPTNLKVSLTAYSDMCRPALKFGFCNPNLHTVVEMSRTILDIVLST